MKQQLLINQILYYREKKKNKILELNIAKEKGEISEYDYTNSIKTQQGAMNALDMNLEDVNLSSKILEDINMWNKAKATLKINFLDKQDTNLGLFFMLSGASTQLMLLLTVPENSLSACPLNKDILLSENLIKLNSDLESAIKNSDKKKISDIKNDIKITTALYNKNLETLKNGH